jgi:RND family efflux transporter MFP subunit
MKRFSITVLILIISAGAGVWYWNKHHSAPAASVSAMPEPALVSTVKAKILTIPLQIKALGQVVAPQTVMLKTQIAGPVTGLFFKSGEFVQKNQLLIQVDQTAAKAAAAQQLANYSNSETQYDRLARLSKLSKSADVSANQLFQAKNTMLASKAQWEAAEKNLADTQIRAPFAGTIGLPQAVPSQIAQLNIGTYLAAGDSVALLSNTREMLVQYQVPEFYSDTLKLGQPIAVSFMAFPNKVFHGHVTYISPVIYQNTQAYNVRAAINDPGNLLRSGMNANVTQTIDPNRKIIAIPGTSLVPSLSGYSVYTIEKSKVKEIPVTIGQHFNGLVAIKSGLKAGDAVIESGQLNVHPGMTVTVKAADTAKK